MRRLGKVLHADKLALIVRSEHVPKLGSIVRKGNRKVVGKVSDVFGPVDFPYIAIKPSPELNPGEIPRLLGEEIYVGGKTHGRKKRKKAGRARAGK